MGVGVGAAVGAGVGTGVGVGVGGGPFVLVTVYVTTCVAGPPKGSPHDVNKMSPPPSMLKSNDPSGAP